MLTEYIEVSFYHFIYVFIISSKNIKFRYCLRAVDKQFSNDPGRIFSINSATKFKFLARIICCHLSRVNTHKIRVEHYWI